MVKSSGRAGREVSSVHSGTSGGGTRKLTTFLRAGFAREAQNDDVDRIHNLP